LSALIATVVSALCYGLAFPPLAWRPLAWVAFVPFLVAVRCVPVRRVLLLGWLWTVVAAVTAISVLITLSRLVPRFW